MGRLQHVRRRPPSRPSTSRATWAEEEAEVRANLRPFRTFGAKIEAEETSPPTEIEPGKWETRHTGSFPFGSVKMIFIWEQFDGEWLLTYAEAQ